MRKYAIIPAHNESQRIAEVISEASKHADRILVLDDGSSDKTARIALRAGAVTVRLSENQGIGPTLQTGYDYAIRDGAEVIIQLDADGQHDPSQIPLLARALGEDVDIVIGSRILSGSLQSYSFPRRIGIRFLSFLVSVLGARHITDVTSGYRVFRREALASLPPLSNFHWAVEQTLLALRLGMNIREVPVPIPPREEGQSQFSFLRGALYPIRVTIGILRALSHSRRSDQASGTAHSEAYASELPASDFENVNQP